MLISVHKIFKFSNSLTEIILNKSTVGFALLEVIDGKLLHLFLFIKALEAIELIIDEVVKNPGIFIITEILGTPLMELHTSSKVEKEHRVLGVYHQNLAISRKTPIPHMLNRVIVADEGLLILGLVEGDLPDKFKLSSLRIVELHYQQGWLIS